MITKLKSVKYDVQNIKGVSKDAENGNSVYSWKDKNREQANKQTKTEQKWDK